MGDCEVFFELFFRFFVGRDFVGFLVGTMGALEGFDVMGDFEGFELEGDLDGLEVVGDFVGNPIVRVGVGFLDGPACGEFDGDPLIGALDGLCVGDFVGFLVFLVGETVGFSPARSSFL